RRQGKRGLDGVWHTRSADAHTVGRKNPHVEPGAVEQLAKRDRETAREEQHVEQQRADGGDAEDADQRSSGLTNEAARGEDEGARRHSRRAHRLVTEKTSRRSSVQEEATAARTPSGTAIATDRRAIQGVTRTNTSAVS